MSYSQLMVHIFCANNLPPKSGFMDKTDAYVEVVVGDKRQCTAVFADCGSNAEFNETLMFDYDGEDELTVNIHDKDKFRDDFLGTGVLALGDKLAGYQGTLAVFDANGHNGEVILRVQGQ
eukprot:Protomagalhaensia_wolfi_Nauph_80__3009@NODE_3084_length_897_cov_2740_897436_g2416_i0_p1_GENE_NODE_3084_length_897_cov_2740_897436_g2416_i0NODE_3084_length_897_cov_2740_897436_g2416_i0_p1_ORF_typecomplete_len120_score31_24C2/PF00168_30/5_1e16_NODE_3084_length_897_cov_2740_897436_g2416_i0220579